MKNLNIIKSLAVLLTLFVALPAFSQEKEKKREKRVIIIKKSQDSADIDGRDTIEIHMDEIEEFDTFPEHYEHKIPGIISSGNMNLGFTNAMSSGKDYFGPTLYSKFPELSTGNSIHIGLENNWGFNLVKGKLRAWVGLRYDINNYRFDDPDTRLAGNQPYFTTSMDSNANSTKSKVVVNYLGIPVALGFQSNAHRVEDGFFIRAGVNAGYRVRTHSKVKLENGNKDKEFDDFNFNDVAITPFVYVGYNSIGLYARYTTTPLFKEGQGEDLYAVQFGLIIQ